ncbi:MAG: lactate dehydrogenase [Rhodospirillaceae bacterium]|nr:lactate dehydrogenase [Rhodospirillaceae bacterium]|tara:strand:- start:420 stop:1493 length:1074 start_codon:yes stop_codon:yes gene_type:complete
MAAPAITKPIRLSLEEARALARDVFAGNGCSDHVADVMANSILLCERDGPASHGFFAIENYLAGLRRGYVDGRAVPTAERAAPGVIRVDGQKGWNQVAIHRFCDDLVKAAREAGIATLAIRNGHNVGPLRHDVEPLAEAGLVAFTCVVSRPHMTPHRGARKIFGTDPIAFACPRREGPPIVWDMATSAISLMEMRVAAETGAAIPPDAAVDKNGAPTTDSRAAIEGGMLLPMAGHKGSAIAFMVELLAAGLTGGRFAFENADPDASDFVGANRGQIIIAMDPDRIHGPGFTDRVADLLAAYAGATEERVPGDGRLARRAKADAKGITLDAEVLGTVRAVADPGTPVRDRLADSDRKL